MKARSSAFKPSSSQSSFVKCGMSATSRPSKALIYVSSRTELLVNLLFAAAFRTAFNPMPQPPSTQAPGFPKQPGYSGTSSLKSATQSK